MSGAIRLVVVAVDRGRAVINEGPDTAGNFPVTMSRALVRVVEEAVICELFVRRWLRDRVERVIDGAFEGGHLGSVARLMGVKVVGGGHVPVNKRSTRWCGGNATSVRQNLWPTGSLGSVT